MSLISGYYHLTLSTDSAQEDDNFLHQDAGPLFGQAHRAL